MPHEPSSRERLRRPRTGAASVLVLLLAWTGSVNARQTVPAPLPPAAPNQPAAPVMAPGTPTLPPADAVTSAAPAVPAPGCGACAGGQGGVDWSKVPPVTPMPRVGAFPIPPTGPGYYSLLDVITDHYRENPPKTPYPPVSPMFFPFFDADFRYLDDPNNTQHDWSDVFKRIHLGDNFLFTMGGEERFRYMNEVDSRLTGRDNVYELTRSRVFGDLWFRDVLRVYAEFIDARTYNEDLPPLPIDQNKNDFLNLFVELKLLQLADNPLYVRVGRQELLYGSQRLISPLDWANTLRTFEGVKAYWHSEKLDLDTFYVKPVLISPSHFDSADENRRFFGAWATYKPEKGHTVDLYYLYLDNTNTLVPRSGGRQGSNTSTFGARYAGDRNNVLWDFEGMYQFGDFTDRDISASAFTTGLGYHFDGLPMNPTLWLYNDWASGDHHADNRQGAYGTFNQLFPFGHYYFGFLDLVGRQNIEDLNLWLWFYPTKWITSNVQAHFFWLDSPNDALYNAAGNPIRRSPTGTAGYHVGNEIDFTTNFHLTPHQDILLGYSHLFAGEFIKNTGNPGSPDLFYFQYSFKW